jgi:hypothetical protein
MLDVIGEAYKYEAEMEGMSKEGRLRYHQRGARRRWRR